MTDSISAIHRAQLGPRVGVELPFLLRRPAQQVLLFLWVTVLALPLRTLAATAEPANNNQAGVEAAEGGVGFPILHFVIDGNSKLPSKVVESTLYPFMGFGKGISDVEAARTALEQAYVEAGFQTVLVDIPEQQVEAGRVRLRVTEGRVGRLRVSGSRYFSLERIRSDVPSLAQGSVPHLPTLQAELRKAGAATPDRRLSPLLRAGRTPGTLEAELEVEDRLPLHTHLEVNTRNAAGTSLLRTIGSVRYDNLFQRFHSASFQVQVSPQAPKEVRVLAGTYALPLGEWKLVGYAVNVDSESPVSTAGALSVLGSGRIYGARFIRPVFQSGADAHSLSLGVDRKSFGENIVLLGADSLSTPISYLPFQARYDFTRRGSDNEVARLSLEGNLSFRGIGNRQSEFEDKRFLARANYAYLQAEAEYQRQVLPGTRARLEVNAQRSDSPLISNEQFALGGADTVRAFFESEALGDDGFAGTLELVHALALPEGRFDSLRFEARAFIDGGYVWIRSALPETRARIGLAGSGLGFSLFGPGGFRLLFDWAWRIVDPFDASADPSRMHMTASYDF